MNKQNNKGTCLACSCPCEAHKEHIHGDEQKPEKKNVCTACSCPCDTHKEHNH